MMYIYLSKLFYLVFCNVCARVFFFFLVNYNTDNNKHDVYIYQNFSTLVFVMFFLSIIIQITNVKKEKRKKKENIF